MPNAPSGATGEALPESDRVQELMQRFDALDPITQCVMLCAMWILDGKNDRVAGCHPEIVERARAAVAESDKIMGARR